MTLKNTQAIHLFQEAERMLDYAYAPYSHFHVGAALLSEDGRIFTGCNVENASYGACICAERTALAKAISEGARSFVAIAVAGSSGAPTPCGICRQMLYEFAPHLLVISGENALHLAKTPLHELLPCAFGPQSLHEDEI